MHPSLGPGTSPSGRVWAATYTPLYGTFISFSCLDPSSWLGQNSIIFLTECLQSRAPKEKNEDGPFIFKLRQITRGRKQNGKEQSARCGELPWILKTSGALISDGDLLRSHLTSPALSHASWWARGTGAFCLHECPRPFRKPLGKWGDTTEFCGSARRSLTFGILPLVLNIGTTIFHVGP